MENGANQAMMILDAMAIGILILYLVIAYIALKIYRKHKNGKR